MDSTAKQCSKEKMCVGVMEKGLGKKGDGGWGDVE